MERKATERERERVHKFLRYSAAQQKISNYTKSFVFLLSLEIAIEQTLIFISSEGAKSKLKFVEEQASKPFPFI